MKINKIVLYNFSSFEGVNEFDFTTTGQERNIILIGGKMCIRDRLWDIETLKQRWTFMRKQQKKRNKNHSRI